MGKKAFASTAASDGCWRPRELGTGSGWDLGLVAGSLRSENASAGQGEEDGKRARASSPGRPGRACRPRPGNAALISGRRSEVLQVQVLAVLAPETAAKAARLHLEVQGRLVVVATLLHLEAREVRNGEVDLAFEVGIHDGGERRSLLDHEPERMARPLRPEVGVVAAQELAEVRRW